jgi:hypothetical protein
MACYGESLMDMDSSISKSIENEKCYPSLTMLHFHKQQFLLAKLFETFVRIIRGRLVLILFIFSLLFYCLLSLPLFLRRSHIVHTFS